MLVAWRNTYEFLRRNPLGWEAVPPLRRRPWRTSATDPSMARQSRDTPLTPPLHHLGGTRSPNPKKPMPTMDHSPWRGNAFMTALTTTTNPSSLAGSPLTTTRRAPASIQEHAPRRGTRGGGYEPGVADITVPPLGDVKGTPPSLQHFKNLRIRRRVFTRIQSRPPRPREKQSDTALGTAATDSKRTSRIGPDRCQ